MIRTFNAFQLVLLFACMPFIIGWLHADPFAYATAVKWVAVVGYLVLFVTQCVAIYELCEGEYKR